MARLRIYMRGVWSSLILAGVLAGLVLSCLLGPLGPRDLALLRQHRRALEARQAALEAENTELETSIQNLRSNPRYIERSIRRELGFARPGEIVYKFQSDSASKSAPN